MKKLSSFIVLPGMILILLSCGGREENLTISPGNISAFLKSHAEVDGYRTDIDSFYSTRNFVPAWITSSGPNDHAENCIERMTKENKDSLYKPLIPLEQLHALSKELEDKAS